MGITGSEESLPGILSGISVEASGACRSSSPEQVFQNRSYFTQSTIRSITDAGFTRSKSSLCDERDIYFNIINDNMGGVSDKLATIPKYTWSVEKFLIFHWPNLKAMKKISLFISMFALLSLNEAIAQWNISGNNIYNTNSGNVGIGNNSPSTLLHLGKNMTEPTITVQNLGGIGGATYTMMDNVSGANWKFKATNSGGFKIRDHANSLDVIVRDKQYS